MFDDFEEGFLMKYIRAITIKDVGKCRAQEAEFEDIAVEQEEEDFEFQEEDATDITQKELFRKSIVLGPEKRPPLINSPPSLLIGKSLFSYGHNCGSHTTTLIGGNLCKAIGVNIFLGSQIYSGHNYEVTYLNYDQEREMLISGTQGKCAQIRLWKVIKTEDTTKLQTQGKVNLPLNSLGVGFSWMNNDHSLLVITKYSFHVNSHLFIFDLKTNKRNRCQCQLDKVIMAHSSDPALVLTQRGLAELTITSQSEGDLKYLMEEPQTSTFTLLPNTKAIILGFLTGKITVFDLETKVNIKALDSHQRQILFLIGVDSRQFISSGGDKKIILHGIDAELQKIVKLKTIDLSSPCYAMHLNGKSLLCCLRTTEIIKISLLSSQSMKVISNPLEAAIIYSKYPNSSVKTHFVFNRYLKKYFYALSDTPEMSILGLDDKGNINSAKKIKLKHCPSLLDVHGNIVSYVYDDQEDTFKSAFKKNHLGSGFSKIKQQNAREFLILEDYPTEKTQGGLQLLEQSKCTCLKINQEGDKLVLGFENGKIALYNINKPQNIVLLKTSQLHAAAINDIIWSKDSKIIKSISQGNMIYLDLLKDKEKLTAIYTAKGIREANWPTCGKFDWKNFNVWNNRLHMPEDITDIKESKDYLLACMANGSLKAFRNPAGKEFQEIIRLFSAPYFCSVIREDEDRFTMVFGSNGAIFGLQIGDYFSEGDEEEDNSFQEVEEKK